MEKITKIHNTCVEFTEKIKEIMLLQLAKECQLYQTNDMKKFAKNQLNEVYLDILDKVDRIENQLNLYID